MSVAGTWQNEYGSLMTLAVEGDRVSGTYSSTTGSVGLYDVTGTQIGGDPDERRGQPVALAIAWHSIGNDSPDASWRWSSGLSGQISVRDGQEMLLLAHSMIASCEFPGLAEAGNYIDKLHYRRITADAGAVASRGDAPHPGAPAIADPVSGTWRSEDGAVMALEVRPQGRHGFGRVSGELACGGAHAAVSGFTDIEASACGLALQSVSMTASDRSSGLAISLSGTLNLGTGVLDLLMMRSSATAPNHLFAQTRTCAIRFARMPATCDAKVS